MSYIVYLIRYFAAGDSLRSDTPTRMLWLGRQANFGLIIGSIIGAIAGGVLKASEGQDYYSTEVVLGTFFFIMALVGSVVILIGWFGLAILSSIFQWGFGFGYGWDTSLIAVGIGFAAAMGLIYSLFVWTKALKRTVVK